MIKTVIKHRYFSGKRAKRSVREYTNYVAYRSGRDRKLGGRKFFSHDRDDISATEVKAILREQSDRGVVAHELMLSPGLQTVDRNDYARRIMKELERKKGLELQWYAVSHEGDHSHIHVIVSGSDANGRRVLFRREDYKDIREWGDRYLEKYHELERYLDRKILEYEKDYDLSYERQKGDKLYELLFTAEKQAEEANLSALLDSWDRRRAIAELEDEEKIYLEGEVYHKYSKVEELESLDVRLLDGSEAKLPKDQYKKLKTWISEKNEYGDDHHERLARESHVRKLVKDMDPEERRKLEKKLEKMAQEREAKYREEDKKKEEERKREDERIKREKDEEELRRKEEDERLEQERKEEDERREKEKLEEKVKELERLEQEQKLEDERIEEERRLENERRAEETRLEEERLEQEEEEKRLEQDRRVEQERKLEALKEKLELARQLEEEKLQAEQERRKEALETIKDFKGFDRDFDQAYQGQSPGEKLFSKKGREQRIQEKRGEYTEWHIRYQNSMARNALEEKMAREPHLKEKIQEDIEKIKELEVKQLESEKLEPIDLEELEANANKYLFEEEEEQEKAKEEESRVEDKDVGSEKPEDMVASKEQMEFLKQQLDSAEIEREIAKEIEFLELEDGTRLTKDSDEKALNEYQDQLIEKIRANYEEGPGYVPDDEIKWTAIEEWKESKRESYELEKADFRDNLDESLRQLSHESYEKHKEQRLRALAEMDKRRDEMYEDGFYDEDGNLVNKDTDTDKLIEITEALNEEDKELDEAEERGEVDEAFIEKNIDIESKRLVIENWLEEKFLEKKYELDSKEIEARLEALELEEIELEDGTSLSKDSDLDDIRAFKEELKNSDSFTMKMLYLTGRNEDEYLDYVTKYSAVERWEDESVERADSVDYEKIWQARMEALEITEIELEDGTVITPDLDAKTLNERSEELLDKEREFEKADKNSKEYYEIARDSTAINNWHTIKEIEETAERGESYWFFGIELDFENDKPFGEDTPIKEKIERIQEATNLAIEYQSRHGYASDGELHPVRNAELRLKLQGILIPDQELERIESDLEQYGKDVYEPLKGLEENIDRHIYLLKDPKEERSLEKDEFDDLIGFPEDERDEEDRERDEDTEKDIDVADDIDKGDQGDKGDTGSKGRESDDSTKFESKPIIDKGPSPKQEKEPDSGGSDRAEDDKGPDKDDDFFDR